MIRRWIRKLAWPYRLLFAQHRREDYAAQAVSWLLAVLRSGRPTIRSTLKGVHELEGASDLAVLVTFDRSGRIHDYLIHQMDALTRAGRTVILVSNSPVFPERQQEKAAAHCALVAWRHNHGYDFGAWRDGLMLVPHYDRLDSVVFANDSVYGPFQPLRPMLDRMDPDEADVWGLTDSWDTRWHLQSYFILYHRRALQHPDVRTMWREWKHVNSKSWVIRNREIGLTALIHKAGLSCAALFPYRDLVESFASEASEVLAMKKNRLTQAERNLIDSMLNLANAGAPMNPTHFFWDRLILDGFPFLKRDVLAVNPIGMSRLFEWERFVRSVSDYDTGLVDRHLRAILKHRVV
jgi:lipopolysaccharide biosynthesis protein